MKCLQVALILQVMVDMHTGIQRNGPPQNYRNGPPPNYQNGLPQNYQNGPPPNYQNGLPPNYQNGLPPNYQKVPPLNYQNGPPPNYQNGLLTNYQNGPPPNYQNGLPPNYQNSLPPNYQEAQPQNYQNDPPPNDQNIQPQNYRNGPPSNYQIDPPPNYQNGPPPNYQIVSPPNYQNGPPQSYQNGPPPNHQNGPPPNNENAGSLRSDIVMPRPGAVTPPTTRHYDPNYGYKEYWPGGDWILHPTTETGITTTTKKTPRVCGRQCPQVFHDITEVCARWNTNDDVGDSCPFSWTYVSKVMRDDCNNSIPDDFTKGFQTYESYCHFLAAECFAFNNFHNDTRLVFAYGGKCKNQNEYLLPMKDPDINSRMDGYIQKIKDRFQKWNRTPWTSTS